MWHYRGRSQKSVGKKLVTSYMDGPLEKLARLCTIVSHPLKTKVFSVFTTQISLVISHRADLWSRPMSHFRQQICYWNKKPWQKKRDFYLYLKLCQMGYEFSTKVFKVPTPHIHLHLIFEISCLKNLVRWIRFFVYYELEFCRQ